MRKLLGLLAFVFYLADAGYCIHLGCGEEALWACHVAAATVVTGLLFGWRTCVAAGCYCLTVGTPLWAVEVALGGGILPTSFGTHVGGLVLAWLGLGLVRTPRHAWWKGIVGLAVLQQVCRWWTPEAANINAAFVVYSRFTPLFPSSSWYAAALLAVATVTFWALDQAFRALFPEATA